MAWRIENPDVDELGGDGGVMLTAAEFEQLLDFLGRNGIEKRQIAMMRDCGFVAGLERGSAFDWAFDAYQMQSDVRVLSICREDSLEAMRKYIIFCCREGSWPTS